RFFDHLEDGVILGHHIANYISSLDPGYERHWCFTLSNRWRDTIYLALHLQHAGAFSSRRAVKEFTLDALCDLFGIAPHGRHTASGDAYLTAEVFLRLRPLALRHGRGQLAQICAPFEEEEAG